MSIERKPGPAGITLSRIVGQMGVEDIVHSVENLCTLWEHGECIYELVSHGFGSFLDVTIDEVPDLVRRCAELLDHYPCGAIAFVGSNDLTQAVFATLAKRLDAATHICFRAFSEEKEALQWVLQAKEQQTRR